MSKPLPFIPKAASETHEATVASFRPRTDGAEPMQIARAKFVHAVELAGVNTTFAQSNEQWSVCLMPHRVIRITNLRTNATEYVPLENVVSYRE